MVMISLWVVKCNICWTLWHKSECILSLYVYVLKVSQGVKKSSNDYHSDILSDTSYFSTLYWSLRVYFEQQPKSFLCFCLSWAQRKLFRNSLREPKGINLCPSRFIMLDQKPSENLSCFSVLALCAVCLYCDNQGQKDIVLPNSQSVNQKFAGPPTGFRVISVFKEILQIIEMCINTI